MYDLLHFTKYVRKLKHQLFGSALYTDMLLQSRQNDRWSSCMMLYSLVEPDLLSRLLHDSRTDLFVRSQVRDLYAVLNECSLNYKEQSVLNNTLRRAFNFQDGVTEALVYSKVTYRVNTMSKMYEDLYLVFRNETRVRTSLEDQYVNKLLADVSLDALIKL